MPIKRVPVEIPRMPWDLRRQVYISIAPEPEIVKRTVNSFRSMLLIGPMQRGKTSWTEAFLGEVVRFLVEERGVDEREIAYVYSQGVRIDTLVEALSREIDLGRVLYLFIFGDDAAAASGQHGRRAASRENVAASQYYIMIRHILRRRHGYERHITAIHATQVYRLLDKTFREASEVDVLKALPKSEEDRKQVLGLIMKRFREPLVQLLASLDRQRVMARTLDDFLRTIYTAVVIHGGVPYVVETFDQGRPVQEGVERRKAWLERVQHIEVQPDAFQEPHNQTGTTNGEAALNKIAALYDLDGYTPEEARVLIELLERIIAKGGEIRSHGNHYRITVTNAVVTLRKERNTMDVDINQLMRKLSTHVKAKHGVEPLRIVRAKNVL